VHFKYYCLIGPLFSSDEWQFRGNSPARVGAMDSLCPVRVYGIRFLHQGFVLSVLELPDCLPSLLLQWEFATFLAKKIDFLTKKADT
jgi:hypothetical protein